MTRHAIIAHIMIATGILGTGAKVMEWTSVRPVISQRTVKLLTIGTPTNAGRTTAGSMN